MHNKIQAAAQGNNTLLVISWSSLHIRHHKGERAMSSLFIGTSSQVLNFLLKPAKQIPLFCKWQFTNKKTSRNIHILSFNMESFDEKFSSIETKFVTSPSFRKRPNPCIDKSNHKKLKSKQRRSYGRKIRQPLQNIYIRKLEPSRLPW